LVEQFAYVLETDEKKHKSANKKKTFWLPQILIKNMIFENRWIWLIFSNS
jgi:hypothetical protein